MIKYIPFLLAFLSLMISSGGSAESSVLMDAGKYIRVSILLLSVLISLILLFSYKRKIYYNKYLLLFLVFCFLSSIWSYDYITAIAKSFEYTVFVLASYAVIYGASLKKTIDNTKFSILIVVSFIFISSIYFNLITHGAPFLYSPVATSLGFSIVIINLYLIINYKLHLNMNYKLFLLVFVAMLLTILIGSRTSLLLVVVSFLWLLPKKNKLLSTLVLTMASIISLFLIAIFPNLIELIFRGQDIETLYALSGRVSNWTHAIQMFQEQPIIGYGYYSGVRHSATFSYDAYAGYEFSTLDNTYLDLLISVGLFGSILLLIFIYSGLSKLKKILKNYKYHNDEYYILLFAYTFVLLTLVRTFFAPGIAFAHWNLLPFLVVLILSERIIYVKKLQ